MMPDFSGVKIALFCDDKIIVIQRDNKPGLRFANMWDLPGGARDGDETPLECIVREVYEELGIKLEPTSIKWQKTYPAMHDPGQTAYFMVAEIPRTEVERIKFGDEGQGWKLISVSEIMNEENFVAPFKDRIRRYLETKAS